MCQACIIVNNTSFLSNVYFNLESLSIASSRTIQLALFILHCDNYAYQSIVMKDIPSLEFFMVD